MTGTRLRQLGIHEASLTTPGLAKLGRQQQARPVLLGRKQFGRGAAIDDTCRHAFSAQANHFTATSVAQRVPMRHTLASAGMCPNGDPTAIIRQPTPTKVPKKKRADSAPTAHEVLGTLSESIDKVGAHYASLGPGIPDPTDDGIGASSSDGRIRDSYRIVANSVLGGLHHEYRLEPVGCLSPATSIAFAGHKVPPH